MLASRQQEDFPSLHADERPLTTDYFSSGVFPHPSCMLFGHAARIVCPRLVAGQKNYGA